MTLPVSLCISLGHNASAVAIRKDGYIVGYEEERLTRVKSDSRFPRNAIDEIARNMLLSNVVDIFVSHWFDNFNPSVKTKYWDPEYIKRFPGAQLRYTDELFSHHDAHAYSALAFYEEHEYAASRGTIVAVCDGFGTNQEHFSCYEVGEDDRLHLLDRVRGYDTSLGLMYQYAATACGMDGINDVWKFLGYRTKLKLSDTHALAQLCDDVIENLLHNWSDPYDYALAAPLNQAIDYDALRQTQEQWHTIFAPLIDGDIEASRARVGWCAQYILEQVLVAQLTNMNPSPEKRDLILAGGCFYNVRLNDKIRHHCKYARICVMPLAGDQGAALGFHRYVYNTADLQFGDLCWGKRRLPVFVHRSVNITYLTEEQLESQAAIHEIANLLNDGMIINLVRSHMEFGPRALCSTSTLAKPTDENVAAINYANGRSSVMPMAPVMRINDATKFFNWDPLIRTKGSDRFMVTAHDYRTSIMEQIGSEISGAALRDIDGSYSGRPQLITTANRFMFDLLGLIDNGILINTSLNLHGQPIVFSQEDLIETQKAWREKGVIAYWFMAY